MSIFTILGISLLALWLFAFPISSLFKIPNPAIVGVIALGLLVQLLVPEWPTLQPWRPNKHFELTGSRVAPSRGASLAAQMPHR